MTLSTEFERLADTANNDKPLIGFVSLRGKQALHNKRMIEYIITLYKAGTSLRDIAEQFEVSHESIRKLLIDYNVINGKQEKRIIKIGDKQNINGYVQVFMGKGFPGVNRDGWIYEHRLVMQKSLKRVLEPWEVVHHNDRNKKNNNLDNLKVISRNDHPTCIACPYYKFFLEHS